MVDRLTAGRRRPRTELATARASYDAMVHYGSVKHAAAALGVSEHTIGAHAELLLAQAHPDHWTHRHRGLLGVLPRACIVQADLRPEQVRTLLTWGVRNLVPGLGEVRAPKLLARINRALDGRRS
jgi:hypothetical protein